MLITNPINVNHIQANVKSAQGIRNDLDPNGSKLGWENYLHDIGLSKETVRRWLSGITQSQKLSYRRRQKVQVNYKQNKYVHVVVINGSNEFNMKVKRTPIPYHIVVELRANILKKYSKLQIHKNGFDSMIFVNKKIISVLSRFVLLNELKSIKPEEFDFDDFNNSVINYNGSEYRVYGYSEKEEFIYFEKGKINMNYVFLKFFNNFRQVQTIENIKYEDLLEYYQLDANEIQLKIPINILEKKTNLNQQKIKYMKLVTFFSGAGGLDLGFEKAGF